MASNDECLIELYHTCNSVLAKYNGDAMAAKEYIERELAKCDVDQSVLMVFQKAIDVIYNLNKKESVA